MDVTEITAVRPGIRAHVRRWVRRPVGTPSLRAQIALLASAFLLGGVLAGLLFVGVWRHTAAEGDRARSAQLLSKQALDAAKVRLARSERNLARTRASLVKLRGERRRLGRELNRRRAVDGRLASSLPSISANAGAIEQKTAKLGSALATLRDYLRNASATGIDPAFLAAQVGYLIGSAGAARAMASQLATEAQSAQASLHSKR